MTSLVSLKTKNDYAWEMLFDKYHILDALGKELTYKISSKQINEFREARLMAKFDESSYLPEVFRDNQLSILPVSRGEYVIGKFKTHQSLNAQCFEPHTIQSIGDPQLETLNPDNLYSESLALSFAYNSGIFEKALGIRSFKPTVNGRMGSGNFEFQIMSQMPDRFTFSIQVVNSQLEIDAGYESSDAFVICEAKNHIVSELLVRQLYYPYRLWSNTIRKPVIPIFLVYTNGNFHLFIYQFTNLLDYNSLALQSHQVFSVERKTISLSEIVKIYKSITKICEPDVVFPQANSFSRILDLLSVLHDRQLSWSEVAIRYEFDLRQTDYYITACEYLGLVKRISHASEETSYALTMAAKEILNSPYKVKCMSLVRRILSTPVFNEVFKVYLQTQRVPDVNSIVTIMSELHFHQPMELSTIRRRASTVRRWMQWIVSLTEK